MKFLNRLSIRLKLGLLLASMTTVMLIVYAWMVLNSVQKDKLAYIYDSSLVLSTSVAEQLHQTFSETIERLNFYVSQYNSRDGFTPLAKDLITRENMIQALYIANSDADWLQIENLSKLSNSADDEKIEPALIEKILKIVSTPLSNSAQESQLFFEANNNSSWYILVRARTTEKSFSVFMKLKRPTTLQALFESQIQDLYLVDTNGNLVTTPRDPLYEIPTEALHQYVKSLIKDAKSDEFITEKEIPSHGRYLSSLTRIPFNGLKLLSVISKSTALEALYLIFAKSVMFLLILLLITFIVSLIAPLQITGGLRRLLMATKEIESGKFDIKLPVQSSDEVGGLSKSFNHMAEEIQRLMQETAEKARMENELKTAQLVQNTLFPTTQLLNNQCAVHGFIESASECGGDWWNYSQVGGKTFIWIGDVTGHGAPAALVTAAACSVASVCKNYPEMTPKQILGLLNTAIYATTKGKYMMTFFLGCLNEDSNTFTYSVASHEPAMLLPYSQGGELKKDDIQVLLENNGKRLGEHPDSIYEETTVAIKTGDRIFCYTDGVTDLTNPSGKMFGDGSLMRTLVKVGNAHKTPDAFFTELLTHFNKFRSGTPLNDDMTFVVFERTG